MVKKGDYVEFKNGSMGKVSQNYIITTTGMIPLKDYKGLTNTKDDRYTITKIHKEIRYER